jgi:hypothetical protein
VNLSEFRPGDWLIMASATAMLIFGLSLDWASLGRSNNAFDYFLTGGIAYLLVVAAGVVTVLLGLRVIKRESARWSLILLLVTGVATALMLLRLILGAGEIELSGGSKVELSRASGMYFAFFAAVAALIGAVMNLSADRAGVPEGDSEPGDDPRG